MPATYQSAATTIQNTATTSFVVTMPGSVASGDLLVAVISGGADNLITPPAGWTQLTGATAGAFSAWVYYRISGGSEPGTYTWTHSLSQRAVAIVTRISGVDTSDPFDAFECAMTVSNSTSAVCPSGYAFTSDALLVCGAVGGWGNSFSFTPPGTVTERADVANTINASTGACMCLGTQTLAASGASGTRTWTASASIHLLRYTLLIRAAGSAARDHGQYTSHQATRQDTASTSAVIDMPSGVASGDLLLACIGAGVSNTITPPAGWTAVQTNVMGNAVGGLYSRVAGGSEPSTYTWTLGTSQRHTGVIVRCSGASGTPTINVSGTGGVNTNSVNYVAPSVTTTGPNTTLFTFIVGGWDDGPFNAPATRHIKLVEIATRAASAAGSCIAAGVEVVAATGATGTRTWTTTTPLAYVSFSVALGAAASSRRRDTPMLLSA